jgi:hypothetical protein
LQNLVSEFSRFKKFYCFLNIAWLIFLEKVEPHFGRKKLHELASRDSLLAQETSRHVSINSEYEESPL